MRKHAVSWTITILLVAFAFLNPAQAQQGQNLLTNPGFEKPFVTVDGNPPRQVAQGWSPWNIGGGQSASENVQPEYYPASDVTNGLGVPRIRGGSDAQQYHSFFATHDGGVFQRVTGITKGAQLRFSAYIYVWSSTFDDVNKSEGDGSIVVEVGIDPTGGTSGDSTSIVWSAPAIQYDSYNEYSVTATAQENAVTVFVRSTVSTPVKNNNIYVDDASLTIAGASVATATKTNVVPSATSTIPPSPTRQQPAATSTSGDLGIVTATLPPTQTSAPVASLPPPTAVPTLVPTVTSLPPTSVSAPPTTVPTQEAQLPTATVEIPTATPTAIGVGPIPGDYAGKILHTVRSGDTVGELASLYGSSIEAITDANGLSDSVLIRVGQILIIPVKLAAPATSTPTPTSLAPAPTAVPVPTTSVYIVQTGDTLFRVAARFNTTASTLAQLNGITNINVIRVGQRLVVPTSGGTVPPAPATTVPATTAPSQGGQGQSYVVRPGDTLFRIAIRFNVPLRTLIQANSIADANRVYVGQVLVIP